MIVPRRPPWYRDRGIPCAAPDDIWCMENVYSLYGDGFLCYERSLFQKWGSYDEIVHSSSVQFTAEEFFTVLDSTWTEVVILDQLLALRARSMDLGRAYAMSRLAGVDVIDVYLPVFCANHLRSLGDLHA